MDEFRIEINCKKCGFLLKMPITENSRNLYKIFVEHYNSCSHSEYNVKVVPGCSKMIEEISFGLKKL